MTDKQKQIILNYLSDDQLERFNGLNNNGEFINYPEKTKSEYYGIKGKIVDDGIIIRETIIKLLDFDKDFAPLSTIEQVTFRNIEGLNIVVKRELSIDINTNTMSFEGYKALNRNKLAMDNLYNNYEDFIYEFKKYGTSKRLVKEYNITQYIKNKF